MTEDLIVFFVLPVLLIFVATIFYFLDCFLQREARRQFYRDLVRLALLYESSDLFECSIIVPKILGPRITRFASYEALLKDLFNAYESGLTDYHSFSAFVFSLHKSYCFSYRDMIKFKNKLYKEKIKNETHQNDRNP